MPKLTLNPFFPSYLNEDYNSYLLIKIFNSKEHRDYFLSGKLYMCPQSSFTKIEMGEGREDECEKYGLMAYQRTNESYPEIQFKECEGHFYVCVVEHKQRPENYRDNQAFISEPLANKKRKIFCMYTLWFNKINNRFTEINRKELSKFGDYGVVIIDVREFLERIGATINQNDTIINARCGFVDYMPEKNVMEFNPFLKTEKYKSQHEFRICVDTDNTELLELSVKRDFKDIAIPVRIGDFIDSFQLGSNRITFRSDKEVD